MLLLIANTNADIFLFKFFKSPLYFGLCCDLAHFGLDKAIKFINV